MSRQKRTILTAIQGDAEVNRLITEAEDKLIDFLLHYGSSSPTIQEMIDEVQDERTALARAHPYGSIAESMMVEPRKPDPYGYAYGLTISPDGVARWPKTNRDVCDPPPPADPPYRSSFVVDDADREMYGR